MIPLDVFHVCIAIVKLLIKYTALIIQLCLRDVLIVVPITQKFL